MTTMPPPLSRTHIRREGRCIKPVATFPPQIGRFLAVCSTYTATLESRDLCVGKNCPINSICEKHDMVDFLYCCISLFPLRSGTDHLLCVSWRAVIPFYLTEQCTDRAVKIREFSRNSTMPCFPPFGRCSKCLSLKML